jgi:hypothetical protein
VRNHDAVGRPGASDKITAIPGPGDRAAMGGAQPGGHGARGERRVVSHRQLHRSKMSNAVALHNVGYTL